MIALHADQPSSYGVQVLDRVFRILDLLAERPARVAEISARLELHRATVFRLLANLEQRGYVRKDEGTGTYSLGLQLFRLGMKALEEQFPVDRLHPHLDELAAATGHAAQLWLRSGFEALCVDQVDSPRDPWAVGRIGRRLPLNSGAVGKVLLAFAPTELIDRFLEAPLPRVTPRTTTNPRALRAELVRIRAEGWALSEGETIVRSWAIAAPVRDAMGAVEQCVCILAVGDELPDQNLARARRAVQDAAARMSRTLGFLPERYSLGEVAEG